MIIGDLVSGDLMREAFPNCRDPDDWAAALRRWLPRAEINTAPRLVPFLAQTGHECGGYTVFEENFNYSVDGLLETFRKYFTRASAEGFGRIDRPPSQRRPAHQEAIANLVYANRLGNGPQSSGDGHRFRGRGVIQLTGRENYAAFAAAMGLPSAEAAIQHLASKDGMVAAAVWYWRRRGLNDLADKGDHLSLTIRINGGTNGLAERLDMTQRLGRLIQARLHRAQIDSDLPGPILPPLPAVSPPKEQPEAAPDAVVEQPELTADELNARELLRIREGGGNG
jgi:putative chitinase